MNPKCDVSRIEETTVTGTTLIDWRLIRKEGISLGFAGEGLGSGRL